MKKPTTDQVFLTLMAPPLELDAVPAFLDQLEAEPVLMPTHASGDERKRLPYARQAATDAAASGHLSVWRTKGPRHSGWLTTQSRVNGGFKLEFDPPPSPAHTAAVFDGATRIASILRPEFGFVHRFHEDPKEGSAYNRGVKLGGREFDQLGPANIYTRTWFGPYLVKLLGKEFFLGFPLATETPWGAVQVDLVQEAWKADFGALSASHEEAMNRLKAAGIIGEYKGAPFYWRPGPRWVSPEWQPRRQ